MSLRKSSKLSPEKQKPVEVNPEWPGREINPSSCQGLGLKLDLEATGGKHPKSKSREGKVPCLDTELEVKVEQNLKFKY